MKNIILFFVVLFLYFSGYGQPLYKVMMDDYSKNFYEVVEAAELYFSNHPKGKGSGWKGYQRWKWANEYKYYPSGDRSQADPRFIEKAHEDFKLNTPPQEAFYGSGWRDLGPYSIDSITGHYSAGLGRVEDFYVNPNNTQTMYLGSRSGGFWRTTDGGQSWVNTTDFLVASGVDAIAVSPTNPDSVIINVKNARNGNTHGVYRSSDGGMTWQMTNFNPSILAWGGLGTNDKIFKIAYHPTIPNLIFIGTSRGIFRSDNNLTSWTQLLSSSDIIDIDFHPTNSNIMYLYDDYYWGANQNVVMRSTNAGLSFTTSNTIVGNNDAKSYISVSNDCPSCVYFASSNGIWKSVNEGIDFTLISPAPSSFDGFAINDLDTSKMIYGYLDLFGSTDGGQNFNQIAFWSQGTNASFNNGQYIHADLRDAKCINGVYYVATDGFLSKSSNDGLTWDILSQGTGIRENYSLGVSQSNHYRTIVGSQDNGTSIKQKPTWIEFYGADGMEGIIHPLNDDWMMGSIQNGARRLTKDGGFTQGGATPPGQTASWIAPLIYDPNDHMTVYSFGDTVYKSENFGSSWTNIGTPNFTGTITEAAIAQNNSDIIIVSKGSSIEKSITGGSWFFDISNNLPNATITDIAFDPRDDNTIIVTFARYQNDNQKVYISTNQGASWTNITHNLSNMPIRKVVIDHLPTPNIYLGAEIGVYTMPLNGSSWSLYNSDLPNMAIEDLEVMWGTNTIRAATWGRGLWEYSLVNRTDFPAIVSTEITNTPTDEQPVSFTDQYVTSVISYDQNITSAYVKWSENSLLFDNTIAMTNTIDSTWVSSTPIPGIATHSKMYFKVFAVGSNGDTTETYKFMYTSKPSCSSAGNMGWQTGVTLVSIDDINNPSGKLQPYTDYTSTDSCNLSLGESYDLIVNLNTDGNYTIHAKAWIDWNHNENFLDPGEEYDLGTTQNSTDGITTNSPLSITVPNTAILGTTVMRVSAKYNSDPTPCETNFDGEVEDYKVNIGVPELDFSITNTPHCFGDFATFDYTGSNLDSVNWQFTNGITSYSYLGFNNGSIIFNDTGSFNLLITGYIYGQAYTLDSTAIFYINKINTQVDQQENTLTVNSTVGSSYQWVDCDNNWIVIPNENSPTFIATENGNYAVIITNQNCIDTSDCFNIIGLSDDGVGSLEVSVFPNPVKEYITLDLNQNYSKLNIEIYNELGQLVKQQNQKNTNTMVIDLSKLSKGVYHIRITADDKIKKVEIVKI
ncbi:MAG: GEVED domain-containing protein [Crocinitomicaceae bacterium]